MPRPNPETVDLRTLIGQTEERTFSIVRGTVDTEARTVEVAFSSETPVETWFGYEILDHSPGACDLSRMNAGGPVLVCHDRTDQVGAVKKKTARIDSDRMGRAVVRFSRSARGTEIMQDVVDEIRETISVRFVRDKMVLEQAGDADKLPTYRTTNWTVLEISFEPIPGDTAVGVGRSAEQNLADLRQIAEALGHTLNPKDPAASSADVRTDSPQNTDSERTETMPAPAALETPTPTAEAQRESEETARNNEIVALADLAGVRELGLDLILEEGMTVPTARARIKAERAKNKQTETPKESAEQIAARSQPIEIISRVTLRNFKGEKAQENAHRSGQFLLAHVYGNTSARKWCDDHGMRAHSEADNPTGGVLVNPEFENVIIDLREEYGTFRKFANVVPMRSDKLTRPRRTGGLTAYPIGAKGTKRRLTESQKGWDAVNLEAKKLGVLAKYEDELSEDAAIAIADDLSGEAAYAFTIFEDEAGFLGDGTADFHGITGIIPKLTGLDGTAANIAGLVVATGTGADKWAEISKNDTLKLMGRLPKFAYKRGAVWHCSNAFWSEVLLRIITDSGGATAHEQQEGKRPLYQGYPVEISQVLPQVPAVSQVPLLFGNIASGVMFGDRRGVTMKQTDSNDTDFEEDLQSLKATERMDINAHDVGNASATAALRKAGPIVGLITKAS